MFLDSRILFIYVETPLHAGTGAGLGAVDLPIQRERATGYPIVQASGIKGALRSEAPDGEEKIEEKIAVFGPEDAEHAGALSPGDVRILLFPIRSLTGIFAWTTSIDVLNRFRRDGLAAGLSIPEIPTNEPETNQAFVSGKGVVPEGEDTIVLEEFAFTVAQDKEVNRQVKDLAKWLADNALPPKPDEPGEPDIYCHWREKLKTSLVILPNDAFRDFLLHATEVVTRVRLEPDSKTVVGGALWTEEHLPSDSLLYAPVHATRLRTDKAPTAWKNLDPKG